MLNNLTNFFNLIVGRRIKTQLEDSDLIAIGTKQSPALGDYKPTAIQFSDLQTQIGGLQTVSVDGITITGNGTSGNPLVANLASPTYTVGLWPELGGYVVWVSPDGKHGLVSETIDQSVAIDWHESDLPISDPANHSVDGAYFADWRLPTKFELDNYLYPQRAAIGNFDETPFPSSQPYWASSALSATQAWIFDFAVGSGGLGNQAKSNFGFIRSVRSF